MIIKNLTPEEIKFEVQERTGEHNRYKLSLRGFGSTDIDRTLEIVNLPVLTALKVIEVEGYVAPSFSQGVESLQETPEEVVEEKKEENPQEPESLKCDICGAEFASARGLAAHKNRAHQEA